MRFPGDPRALFGPAYNGVGSSAQVVESDCVEERRYASDAEVIVVNH
jgi:hypothetical protein